MTLVKFVQNFVMPLGFRLLHLRDEGSGDLPTTTATTRRPTAIKHFRSPNAPKKNSLSERDRRMIMVVILLSGSVLPKFILGKMVTITTLFLLNHPPNKTIDGNASNNRITTDMSTCAFYGLLGPVYMGAAKRILR